MNKFLFTLLLVGVSYNVFAQAQPAWALKSTKNGIKVYTAKLDNSAFKQVKAEFDVNATFSRFLAVLVDVEHHKDWVYSTKSEKILKPLSNTGEMISYCIINTPWPFSNRDYITSIKIEQPNATTVLIEANALPNYIPLNGSIVRIVSSHAHWAITKTAANQLHVVYTIQFNPGGNIPAWLVNNFITDGPSETFKKLKERVNMPQYQNTHFNFIKD